MAYLNLIKIGFVSLFIGMALVFHIYEVKQARYETEQKYEQLIKDSNKEAEKKTVLIANQSKALERLKDEQIKSINDKLNAALNSLHNRPSRPSIEYVTIAEDRSSCTGRELFREDAEFLTREAARADRILKERDYYFEQYENARKKLNVSP